MHERKFSNRWIVMEDGCLGKRTQILNLLLFKLILINGKMSKDHVYGMGAFKP
mgnify:CR=1 FL=1